ncbi:pantetheine-phosphate adenylyltransferase [Ligilactobacillus faecis]|uniref:pantetheine-phosphate adenylyltransferase n=1 Tax=Ligilactobacillus faecis TaxID=762833 RepID=UPI0024686AFF|nr:pantetheine-phosphate adenylyltransferase [Ligilactobacillus faecis]WGN89406.1 pantetheine-phosphate adenylyltransferase [Ligilactobacillus faecis]
MRAIFPGSFDPVTNGHLDVIARAARLFDEVFVVILTNTSKTPLFTATERLVMLEEATKNLKNVVVQVKDADLTVNVAEALNAGVIVRAVRNALDLEYERNIAQMNKTLAPKLETILLMTDPKYSHLSSTLVKEVAQFGGDFSELVPPNVALALAQKNK